MLVSASIPALSYWIYARYLKYAPELNARLIAGIALGGGFCLYILYRILADDCHWRTDSDGLLRRGLLRRRFKRWQDMDAAQRVVKKRDLVSPLDVVQTSIWQHMRECGKTAELPDRALSLWDEIPDALPTNLEWTNHRRMTLYYRILVGLSAVLVLAGLLMLALRFIIPHSGELVSWAVLAWMYAGLFRMLARIEYQFKPEYVSLCDNVLHARFGKETIDIRRGDITAACWVSYSVLELRGPGIRVAIPLDSVREDSAKLVLAVIRWLRASEKPIAVIIPEDLRVLPRQSSAELPPDVRSAEVHPSFADRISGVVLWLMFPVLWTALALSRLPTAVIVVVCGLEAVAGSVLVWWLTGRFGVVADESGLTKCSLFWKRGIAWHDVANLTMGRYAGAGVQNTTPRFAVWDASGHLLFSFTRGYGSRADWEKLLAFAMAQLRRVLSPDTFNKPWKSRPRS